MTSEDELRKLFMLSPLSCVRLLQGECKTAESRAVEAEAEVERLREELDAYKRCALANNDERPLKLAEHLAQAEAEVERLRSVHGDSLRRQAGLRRAVLVLSYRLHAAQADWNPRAKNFHDTAAAMLWDRARNIVWRWRKL